MAEKKIKGVTYKVDAVLATEALKLQVRVMKLIGGAVERLPAVLRGVGKTAGADAKAESDAAAIAALADIVSKLDPDDTVTLLTDIVSFASIKRPSGVWERVDIDGDFQGEQRSSLFPLVGFVLKEVIGDFFSEILANGNLNKTVAA